jgi:5-methylcytosine-specific restriction protein A
MPKIPREILADHIHRAIEALDHGKEHDFGESRDYDLLCDGRRYPPKAIIGVAAGIATGNRLHPSDFSSGVG